MRNGIAITGASGFIGNRILEMFHLGKVPGLIPVVHSNSSLALPARFALPWKVCDHFSVDELSRAFEGCEAVVHAAYGSPMKTMSEAVYRAADRAGVRRLVVLSSASTYNQNPQPGVTEDSPYPHKAATSYNAAKIAADKGIRRLRPRGRTEVVFLMPGVVYGPRSQWIARVARQGAQGTAYLIDEGQGICNGIYIDNLVEAVRLALIAPGVDGHSFFVSDAETVTWADFYRPILAAIGAQPDTVHRIAASAITRETARERFRAWVDGVVETRTVRQLKPYVPRRLVGVYKTAVSFADRQRPANAFAPLTETGPALSLDMTLLQQCRYKLPNSKAERLLGYKPIVSFSVGMSRSIDWLEFAGYPVTGHV